MNLSRRGFLVSGLAAGLIPGGAFAQGLEQRPPVRPAPDPHDLIAGSGLPGLVGFALSDARGNAMSLGHAALPIAPASTMKVLTALFALDRLGVSHRFRTRIIRSGDMLILAGGGDPVLTTDDLATLAAQLGAAGQTRPTRFAVWGGALPRMRQITQQQADYLSYNPAISGVMLNFNRVHLGWRRVGVDYQLSLEARAARHSPRAYTVTATPASQSSLFTYRADEDREYWTVSRAAMGRNGSRWLPVRLPELYAGDVFQTLCRAQGVVLPSPEVIDDLPKGMTVAFHDSPPLETIIRDMLKYSTNLTAETLGLHASGAQDLERSAQGMRGWLGDIGRGMRLADHSGLSADSLISAFGMVRVLNGPGRDLNLRPLLKAEPLDADLGHDASIPHKVAAKTGTLNFVSNLAGYVTTPDGREGSFAIFCTDPPRRNASTGLELPAGVSTWTHAAKTLQRDMIGAFADRLRDQSVM
ncbi:MAG: D-alanyl-D-alanine carboxypeptidase/D-alanyl-D-alanine-endopeptidase [Paracoccus sp. (in: a-proteobacteria)]|uniref:D-alanyl-D-alanine carboxypeptidase/D-alanyl-D-alanine endopeptidase n=1 Tax=Paracoccus sp. TaxID=267 RepID=UPI003241DE4F